MQRLGWTEIDLLKIDIEGGEKAVLGGQPAWLKRVRCIVGEGHLNAGYSPDACRADLEPLGFDVEITAQLKNAILFLARRRGEVSEQ